MYFVGLLRFFFRSRRNTHSVALAQRSADILSTPIVRYPTVMIARKPKDGQAFCLKGEFASDASPLIKADVQRKST